MKHLNDEASRAMDYFAEENNLHLFGILFFAINEGRILICQEIKHIRLTLPEFCCYDILGEVVFVKHIDNDFSYPNGNPVFLTDYDDLPGYMIEHSNSSAKLVRVFASYDSRNDGKPWDKQRFKYHLLDDKDIAEPIPALQSFRYNYTFIFNNGMNLQQDFFYKKRISIDDVKAPISAILTPDKWGKIEDRGLFMMDEKLVAIFDVCFNTFGEDGCWLRLVIPIYPRGEIKKMEPNERVPQKSLFTGTVTVSSGIEQKSFHIQRDNNLLKWSIEEKK